MLPSMIGRSAYRGAYTRASTDDASHVLSLIARRANCKISYLVYHQLRGISAGCIAAHPDALVPRTQRLPHAVQKMVAARSLRSVLWSPGKGCAFSRDLPSAARLLELRQRRLFLSRSVFKQGPNLTWKRLGPDCACRDTVSHSCYHCIKYVCRHPGAIYCRQCLCAHPNGQARACSSQRSD